jgi:O-acetyl-ADP-ribose deacetylase
MTKEIVRSLKFGIVELVLGNIVEQGTDAIVNAANTKLAGGGGVDGAIHRAAGPKLKEFCLDLPVNADGRRCQTGCVVTTPGFGLRAKYIIHAVGPFFSDKYAQKAVELLRQVHIFALQSAVFNQCRSISFPAISTGAYRFPIRLAAEIAIDVACKFMEGMLELSESLEQGRSILATIRFVLFKPTQFDEFRSALQDWEPSQLPSGV